MRVKVLVVPVFRRHWACHASCTEVGQATAATTHQGATSHWSHGLQERLRVLQRHVGSKVRDSINNQWRSMETAKEGSLQNKLYKLAQYVLKREDPVETFLKGLPKKITTLEVVYPKSLQESLVRRRLRLIAASRAARHRKRLLGWAIAAVPQIPLVLTPIPNVPLYYSMYRIYSHYTAMVGAQALHEAFQVSDAVQAHKSYQAIMEQAKKTPGFNPDSKPELAPLLEKERRYQELLKQHSGGSSSSSAQKVPAGLQGGQQELQLPTFIASKELETMVKPMERFKTPLPDDLAAKLGQHYCLSGFLDNVARVRFAAEKDSKSQAKTKTA